MGANDPCMNGGVCVDGVNDYTCECAAGFSGNNCEVNIDDCANSPCSNRSQCVDGISGYQCVCNPGFSGMHCEINNDDCADSPCQNGGVCIDEVNGYTCSCHQGLFTGKNCETEITQEEVELTTTPAPIYEDGGSAG